MPAISDQVTVAYRRESAFGEAAVGSYTKVRLTSESLQMETASVESAEIRDDRQIKEVVRTNVNNSGDVSCEMSYGTFDDWLVDGLLDSAWAGGAFFSGVVSFTAPSTITAAGANFTTEGFDVNSWIKITGTATNDGYYKLATVGTTTMTVDQTSLLTEAANTCSVEQGEQITNGTEDPTDHSYTIIRRYNDLTSPNTIAQFLGMVINQFTLNVAADAINTGTFSWMGKDEQSDFDGVAVPSYVSGTPNENSVMAAVDSIDMLESSNATIPYAPFCANNLSITVNNNLRQRQCIGTLGPKSFGAGTITVTGTVQAYLDNTAADPIDEIFQKYLDYTAMSIAFGMTDVDGNGYVIDLPTARFTSGTRVAGGRNQDIIADMAFTAYRDPTETITIRIQRFNGASE